MSNRGRFRIFYCGMVNTTAYMATHKGSLHIGAASKKMTTIVSAMRDVGANAYLLSIPVLGRHSRRRYGGPLIVRDRDCPQIFLPTIANPYIRKLYALFCFAWFCTVRVGQNDRIILYNHSIEYVLGLVVLIIKGNRPIVDIEDAPRRDEKGWRGFIGVPLFRIFCRFSCRRKLIVSEALAKILGLRKYCVVYGATKCEEAPREKFLYSSKEIAGTHKPLVVHYGGTINADTGIDLFCDAVALLIKALRRDICQLHFVITGFGAEEKIRELEEICSGTGIFLSYFPNLTPEEYSKQFNRCHAALSLRLPATQMSMTTFPSKVVDITTNGLLLISTKVSDVPVLFDEGNAILLHEATSAALADAILRVIANPSYAQQIAHRGQVRAIELFGSKAVGQRIVDFVFIH